MFTGQGSQKLNMAQDFIEKYDFAAEIMNKIDNALGYKLSEIIHNDNPSKLNQTINTQPAILANAMIIYQAILQKYGNKFTAEVQYLAGHSVGEYCALCTAEVFDFEEGAKILRARAIAMENSCEAGTSGMIALIDADINKIDNLLKDPLLDNKICEIANDNGAKQIVLSGEIEAINVVSEIYKNYEINRAIKLEVSGAFHSSLMKSAAINFTQDLKNFSFNQPKYQVISNVTVDLFSNNVADLLIKQITAPVRWREIMNFAYAQGIRNFLEIGPAPVLANLAKRSFPDIKVATISKLEDLTLIEEFIS